jgi:hypothetical protein
MADQVMAIPVSGIKGWAKEKERRSSVYIFYRLLKGDRTGGDGVVHRMYSSKYSWIADPTKGIYQQLY